MLSLKDTSETQWDLISLGEILLRFDPGDKRIHNSRQFTVWDGGAEYNVAANITRVFRQRGRIVSAIADNALGRLALELARSSGIDTDGVIWQDPDECRNGLYFIERGFGLRPPASAFDRSNTAISRLKEGEIDWSASFAPGARWFHTGGVFAGLSDTTPGVAAEGMKAARDSGSVVSYDLNYRNSLWAARGGIEAANEVNRGLLPYADVVFGTFGFDSKLSKYDESAFRAAAEKMVSDFPDLKMVVSTLRETHSASRHDLGAVCFSEGDVYRSKDQIGIDVLDRVGSGDAFASGFIASILAAQDVQYALDCGVATGALAMTTPGDTSMSTMEEISALMTGGGSAAKR